MCQPQILLDPERWNGAMGLGFFLMRSATGRTWVGHTGGMPGHITGVFTHRESGTGGIALMNSTSAPGPGRARDRAGRPRRRPRPGRGRAVAPGHPVPDELARCWAAGSPRASPSSSGSSEGELKARIDKPARGGR